MSVQFLARITKFNFNKIGSGPLRIVSISQVKYDRFSNGQGKKKRKKNKAIAKSCFMQNIKFNIVGTEKYLENECII